MYMQVRCPVLGRVCGPDAREVESELRFDSIESEDGYNEQQRRLNAALNSVDGGVARSNSCRSREVFCSFDDDDDESLLKSVEKQSAEQKTLLSGGYAAAAGKMPSKVLEKQQDSFHSSANGAAPSRTPKSEADSRFYSCQEDDLEAFVKSVPVRATRDTSFEADEGPDIHLISELRDRLVDVLGPRLVSNDTSAAGATMACFGGYRICCWRFLKACNRNVDAAEKKLRKTFDFRESIAASHLLADPAACEVWENLKDVWPEEFLGSTGDGSPVSFFHLPKAVQFLQLGLSEDQIRTFWLVWMEKSLKMQREGLPVASQQISANDMPASVVVYDLQGLGLSQLTSCFAGLQVFCRVIGLAEEHYPQNLRKAIILNAPGVFARMVWPLVQKILDEETLSNVCVCRGPVRDLKTEQLGFDSRDLISLLGDRISEAS